MFSSGQEQNGVTKEWVLGCKERRGGGNGDRVGIESITNFAMCGASLSQILPNENKKERGRCGSGWGTREEASWQLRERKGEGTPQQGTASPTHCRWGRRLQQFA